MTNAKLSATWKCVHFIFCSRKSIVLWMNISRATDVEIGHQQSMQNLIKFADRVQNVSIHFQYYLYVYIYIHSIVLPFEACYDKCITKYIWHEFYFSSSIHFCSWKCIFNDFILPEQPIPKLGTGKASKTK